MIAKLFVLACVLGVVWMVLKLLGKVGTQDIELEKHRRVAAERKAQEHLQREADIIDLEQDPDTGAYEERERDKR